jgi:predicted secreted protein
MKKVVSGILILLMASMLEFAFTIKCAGSSEPPAVEWARTYGGTSYDTAYSLVQTSDGGYAMVGITYSFGAGNDDMWFVKTGSDGNMQWDKTFGGANRDNAASLLQTGDGGYVVVGHTMSFGSGGWDVWLIKTDSDGNMQWNQTYGGTAHDAANSIVRTSDGGYAIAGVTYSFGAGDSDFWLLKTNANGNMLWNRTFGGVNGESVQCVISTSDGGYAIAGDTYSFGAGDSDYWLVKTDANGNMEWNKTYGGAGWDCARCVVQTSDGGYALTGEMHSLGSGDFWLVKTDADGNMQWNRTYGGPNRDDGLSLKRTSDGGYIIVGITASFGAGGYDIWAVETDESGNMEWNETYGGANDDEAFSVVQTSDGGYAVAGWTMSFGAGWSDSLLVKLAGPFAVSISPLSASIHLGQSVTFTSTTGGGTSPYSYQWYLNNALFSSATLSNWTFTPTTSGIYYIQLKVTDSKANTAQSDTARTTVAIVPVGGYSISIQVHTKTEPVLPCIALVAIFTVISTKLRPKNKRKR